MYVNVYEVLTKCVVKMAGYWPSSFFACFFVSVHKLAKKERGQYPAILTEQTWSIKDLLYGSQGNLACGIQRVVPSGQDEARSGSRSLSAIWVILPARGASHIIRCVLGQDTLISQRLSLHPGV